MNYFDQKDKLAKIAKEHTEVMAVTYLEEIKQCVMDTYVIDGNSDIKDANKIDACGNGILPNVYMKQMTTVEAILDTEGPCVVLNFASYKEPGGMFTQGSHAQEETLCHASFLYNVLSQHQDYYNWNKKHMHNGMYMNRALVSPNVIFDQANCFAAGRREATVITCAAPNNRYCNEPNINATALSERIGFVFNVAGDYIEKIYGCKPKKATLVLGAFGCGVFKQDPGMVAYMFRSYIMDHYADMFTDVVFAILSTFKNTYYIFENMLRDC